MPLNFNKHKYLNKKNMNNLKKNVIKFIPILIALTALADTNFDILLQIGLSVKLIGWIKLFGLLLALFLPSIKQPFFNIAMDNTDPQNPEYPKKIG
jgi:hypothetical protein